MLAVPSGGMRTPLSRRAKARPAVASHATAEVPALLEPCAGDAPAAGRLWPAQPSAAGPLLAAIGDLEHPVSGEDHNPVGRHRADRDDDPGHRVHLNVSPKVQLPLSKVLVDLWRPAKCETVQRSDKP